MGYLISQIRNVNYMELKTMDSFKVEESLGNIKSWSISYQKPEKC